jgi:hypothetical protein
MQSSISKIDPRISDIPDEYYINDFRKSADFKKVTFSGYQKTDVLSALQKSILDNKVEEACHWAGEMLVSGHLMECWDRLILINSKNINVANPNLPFYLWSRFVQAIQIVQGEKYLGEKVLNLRNNQECRNHLTDIVTLMTLSPKNKLKTLPKITTEDFRIDYFEEKLEAKHIYLLEKIIIHNDPSEINVVMNEFAFQITNRTGNLEKALYWLNWILEWEKLNIKKAEGFNCATRVRKYIKPQYHHDIVWMIWDVIFQEATIRNNDFLNKQLIALFKLFKYNFTSPGKRKKSPLIVHAINLLAYEDKIKWEAQITNQSRLFIQANANNNLLYLEFIKKSKNNNSYQKKDDGLQVLIRDNYLISDQKIQTSQKPNSSSNSNSKKEKNMVANTDLQKMNMLNMLDKKMMNNTPNNNIPSQRYNPNPFQMMSNSKPYQNTEDVLQQIQSIIQ